MMRAGSGEFARSSKPECSPFPGYFVRGRQIMNSMNTTLDRKGLFHVRPCLLLFCAAFVLLLVCSLGPLPDLIRGPFAQRAILLAASAAISVGWFCTAKYSEPNSPWRVSVAL